jgi:hypothetical protein
MPELWQAIHMAEEVGNDVGQGPILQREMQEDQITKSLERTKSFGQHFSAIFENAFDLFSDE